MPFVGNQLESKLGSRDKFEWIWYWEMYSISNTARVQITSLNLHFAEINIGARCWGKSRRVYQEKKAPRHSVSPDQEESERRGQISVLLLVILRQGQT